MCLEDLWTSTVDTADTVDTQVFLIVDLTVCIASCVIFCILFVMVVSLQFSIPGRWIKSHWDNSIATRRPALNSKSSSHMGR